MGKLSALEKIIQELDGEIAEHQRSIEATEKVIARLQMQRPVKKSKPRVVKKAEAQTA